MAGDFTGKIFSIGKSNIDTNTYEDLVTINSAGDLSVAGTISMDNIKSGYELFGAFSGDPLVASVNFSGDNFPDTDYAVTTTAVTNGEVVYLSQYKT
jgi:hypothetical protein